MIDSRGIECFNCNGLLYYSQTASAEFLGMTLTGLRRKREKLEKEDGIIIPLVSLPVSDQKKFIDRRILTILNEPVRVGEEKKWKEKLRWSIIEILSESVES